MEKLRTVSSSSKDIFRKELLAGLGQSSLKIQDLSTLGGFSKESMTLREVGLFTKQKIISTKVNFLMEKKKEKDYWMNEK